MPLPRWEDLRRLKLVTGVEISTRPVSRSGRLGNATKSASRSSAAPAYMPALERSVMFAMPSEPEAGRDVWS